MSYSFSIRAATKAEAKDAVFTELVKVCDQQPVHAVDSQQANAAAAAFIDVLADDASKDVSVTVSGSVGWNGGELPNVTISSAGVNVYASLVAKE